MERLYVETGMSDCNSGACSRRGPCMDILYVETGMFNTWTLYGETICGDGYV